jgi:hypothetical protein
MSQILTGEKKMSTILNVREVIYLHDQTKIPRFRTKHTCTIYQQLNVPNLWPTGMKNVQQIFFGHCG